MIRSRTQALSPGTISRSTLTLCLLLVLGHQPVGAEETAPAGDSPATQSAAAPDYERDIAPLLTKYCAGCHNADEASGELRLDSYEGLQQGGEHGAILLPGEPAASRLIRVLTGDAEPQMPPEEEPAPSNEEQALLAAWIRAGAAGPTGEAPHRGRLVTPAIAPATSRRPVTALAFAPGGKVLAVGRYETVDLIQTKDLRVDRQLQGHPGKINGLTFTANGDRLVVATGVTGLYGEAWAWAWQAEQPHTTMRWRGHRDTLYAAVPSPDGEHLATASYDHTVLLWPLSQATSAAVTPHESPLRQLTGHNGAIYDLAWTPDSQVVATASGDATVKLWRVRDGLRLDTLGQPLQEQFAVAIRPDGRQVVAGGGDQKIRAWRLQPPDRPHVSPLEQIRFAHQGAIHALRFTEQGRFLVSLGKDHRIKVWDAERLKLLVDFPPDPLGATAIAVSSQTQQIAVGHEDGTVELRALPAVQVAAASSLPVKSNLDSAVLPSIATPPTEAQQEQEPNDTPSRAESIRLPAKIVGTIDPAASAEGLLEDSDLYRFQAQAGQRWIFEIRAARQESPLDSHLAILDANGQPVPQVLLRAVRDSYFTFRGKDSNQTGDFRLHNWEEMQLNEYLYCNGEVVRLYHYPRGPDSGYNVYPNFGKRHAFFGTSSLAHPLHEPCYIVEPYPPHSTPPPNGLPTFLLYYQNDDDSLREWGNDSRLYFVAPDDQEYLIRVRDVRGFGGADFDYELTARPAEPDFEVRVAEQELKVPQGSGKRFLLEVDRRDGFEGAIAISFEELPIGLSVTSPLTIEAGQRRAWGAVYADPQLESVPPETRLRLTAASDVQGIRRRKQIAVHPTIEIVEPAKLTVRLEPDPPLAQPPGGYPVLEIVPGETVRALIRIERRGHEGRVAFGAEGATWNAPHGVYVDNIGLNGVLIPAEQSQRTIFLTAEPWLAPGLRPVFVEANAGGNPISNPIMLRVRAPGKGAPDDAALAKD